MTKKNYIAIANIIKETKEHLNKNTISEPLRFITEQLADYFSKDNERFDYNRFFVACGLK